MYDQVKYNFTSVIYVFLKIVYFFKLQNHC